MFIYIVFMLMDYFILFFYNYKLLSDIIVLCISFTKYVQERRIDILECL